jgi:hypothetical protein
VPFDSPRQGAGWLPFGGPRHRSPLRIQRPPAPPDRCRAAEPGRVPANPKDTIRPRTLKPFSSRRESLGKTELREFRDSG